MPSPTAATSSLLSEAHGEPIRAPRPFVYELFNRNAEHLPNKTAVVSRHQAAGLYGIDEDAEKPYLRWSFRQLQTAAFRLAHSLENRGIRNGMPVATFVASGVEYLIILWACMQLNCPFVPLNIRTLDAKEEALHMIVTADINVIVAENDEVARDVDSLLQKAPQLHVKGKIKINDQGEGGKQGNGWLDFSQLLDPRVSDTIPDYRSRPRHGANDEIIISFTSGTTSLPKGCPHTHFSFESSCMRIGQRRELDELTSLCSIMPGNHAMGYLALSMVLGAGGSVVFAAPAFEPAATIAALEEEQCNTLQFVPTMMHAVIDHMKASGRKYELSPSLCVIIGGAAVTLKVVRQAIDMGAKTVIPTYGMSEGTPVAQVGVSHPDQLFHDGSLVVGTVLSGNRIRICEPESTQLVPRGEVGELHQSGDSLINGYLQVGRTEEFYTDDNGVIWLRTGDQACMDNEGNLRIMGRYKDLIIRGGENISPTKIENVLSDIDGVEAQVVGVTDDIAGEVPVAVYKVRSQNTEGLVKLMQKSVLQRLGSTCIPEEFIAIDALGITDWPKLVSGKVKKLELAALVRTYRASREVDGVDDGGDDSGLRETILHIWSSLLGLSQDDIDVEVPINQFADSISIMRFRDKVRKATGRSISTEEMTVHETIESQIEFLNRSHTQQSKERVWLPRHDGAPTAVDMLHTQGDEERARFTRKLVEKSVLHPLGLAWDDDVEHVFPAPDIPSALYRNLRPLSWSFRFALVTLAADKAILKGALRKTLEKHSMQRSFVVRETRGKEQDVALHVTIRPTERLFKHMFIEESGTVLNAEDLKRYAFNDPRRDHASFPGPLLRIMLVSVEESGTAGLVMNANHVTFDALSMRLFFDDLDQALSPTSSPLSNHIPYKYWADTYNSLRESPLAQEAINWHVRRLKNFSTHRRALLPLKQRAPGWFAGSRRGWTPSANDMQRKYSNPSSKSLNDIGSDDTDGFLWHVELPSIQKLRDAMPDVTAPVIAKAAMALLCVHYTKHSHAVFSNAESGRGDLPFVPNHLLAHLDVNCADVAGPCLSMVMNIIEVHGDEPLGAFLTRMQEEQILLTKYAHAPLRAIMAALGTNAEGTGDGDLLLDAMRRWAFNWAPGTGAGSVNPYANMRSLQGLSRSDVGMQFRAGLGGAHGTTAMFRVRWDDANTTRAEAETMVVELGKVLAWITEGGGLERPIGGFGRCLE